jgi:hypothetical protein
MTLSLSPINLSPIQIQIRNPLEGTSKIVSVALQTIWKGSGSFLSISYTLLDRKVGEKIVSFLNEAFKSIDLSDLLIEGAKGVAVQAVLYKLAKQIVPDKDLVIIFCNITLAALVSTIASTILFSLVSLSKGATLLSAILSTCSGISIGILQCHYGLTAEALYRKMKEACIQSLS